MALQGCPTLQTICERVFGVGSSIRVWTLQAGQVTCQNYLRKPRFLRISCEAKSSLSSFHRFYFICPGLGFLCTCIPGIVALLWGTITCRKTWGSRSPYTSLASQAPIFQQHYRSLLPKCLLSQRLWDPVLSRLLLSCCKEPLHIVFMVNGSNMSPWAMSTKVLPID